MPESIMLDELWLKCRGVENAFRYYSDVLAAVGHDLKSRGLLPSGIPVTDPAARDGIQLTFPSVEHSVGPEECPPWCHISSPLTIEGLGTLSRIADAVTKVGVTLMEIRAQATGGGEHLKVYITEIPGTHWDDMRHTD